MRPAIMPARGKRTAEHEARLKAQREARIRRRMEEAAANAAADLGTHDPLIELLIDEQRSGRSYFTGLDRNLLTVMLAGYLCGDAKRGVVPNFAGRAVVRPTLQAPLVSYGYANPQDFCLARGEQPGTWHVLRSVTGTVYTYSRDTSSWTRRTVRFPAIPARGASYAHYVGLQCRGGKLYAWLHTSGEVVRCLEGVDGADAVECPSRSLCKQHYVYAVHFDQHGRGYSVNADLEPDVFWLNREGMPSMSLRLTTRKHDAASLYPGVPLFGLRTLIIGSVLDHAEHMWVFVRVTRHSIGEPLQRLLAYEFNAVDGTPIGMQVLPETKWLDDRADKFAFDARGQLCALDNKGHMASYTMSPPTLVQACTLSCGTYIFDRQPLHFDDGALVLLGTGHAAGLFFYC